MKLHYLVGGSLLGLSMSTTAVMASATAEEVAKLGGDEVTCMGAKRAGNGDAIPDYSGKWYKTWDGVGAEAGYDPGPYKDEKPLFTITSSNMDEYKDKLTAGQIGMFKKYPEKYKMNVYPTHRDFKFADWVCDVVKENAQKAKVVDDGLGVSGTAGAHPFPFPKTGNEAIWNVINPHRAWTEYTIFDTADVYENGTIAWGKSEFKTLNPGNNPDPKKRSKYDDPINAYFFQKTLLPARSAGEVAVGFQPNNFKDNATQAWQYQPGIRRVRKAPEVGFDYPVPPAGLRTVDDDYIFNGSPERYNWKLIGKKELFVPWHNFKINDPSVKYDQLVTPNTINPEFVRYELKRVWVTEGNLKDGVRHIYKKRHIYSDEDTWLSMTSDSYDAQDQLWRMNMVMFFYSQQSGTYHRGVSVYHNMTSGAYEATYLVNESDKWWELNQKMKKQEFSPQAAERAGQ